MVPDLNINPRVRDIQISFANSCNCCWHWCPKKDKAKEPIYINKKYEVEKFDKRKGIYGDEIQKTYQRLEIFVRAQIFYCLTRNNPDFIELDFEFSKLASRVIEDIERETDIHFKNFEYAMTYEKVKMFNEKLSPILSKNIEEYEIKRSISDKLNEKGDKSASN